MANEILGLGFGVGSIVVALAMYIYMAVALMTIAKRQNIPNGWLAFIPIANIYLMTQIAGLSALWTLVILAGMIPLIGTLVMMVAFVYFWWLIAEVRGKPGWWGILMIIPIVNLVFIGLLAWGE